MRRTASALLTVVGGLSIGALVSVYLGSGGISEISLKPNDEPIVVLGASLYSENCAVCHGSNLEGQPDWKTRKSDGKLPAPPHDETGHTWHHPDGLLFSLTKDGLPSDLGGEPYQTDMPAFEASLTDDQIIAVLSFIKSRWPPEIRDRHDSLNERIAKSETNK